MTDEEALIILKKTKEVVSDYHKKAFDIAIKALEQTDGDLINKFRDYQIEWLTSHNDIDLHESEMWIVRFLKDTAECFLKTELLSVKTGGDLISRTDLLNAIWQKEYGKDYDGVNLLRIRHIDIIEQMPSAEKTAEWIHRFDDYNDWLECSECGYGAEGEVKFGKETNYCPNCGAKMKEVKEE